jgi:3-oxoacyl-[acyl-carrier-protein] synthase-3
MLVAETYVAGCASWLPPAMSTAEAIAEGLCTAAIAARTQIEAVTVAPGLGGPQMAATAADRALRRAGVTGAQVDLLLHAALYYQGHDMWAPAAYVQRMVDARQCTAIDVRQTSNGGMACIELAVGYLSAGGQRDIALLSTGDHFSLPGIDRWRSDVGTVFADGGTAMVLSRRAGFARLVNVVSVADPALEQMHRGEDPFGPVAFSHRQPLDVNRTTRAYLRSVGASYGVGRMAAGQREVVDRTLDEAAMKLVDVDWFVLPNLGRQRMESHFFGPLDIPPERSTWHWGRRIGHLGAGDQFAGLASLMVTRTARPGQRCLLLGVGGGFNWSGAVVEILEQPAWQD